MPKVLVEKLRSPDIQIMDGVLLLTPIIMTATAKRNPSPLPAKLINGFLTMRPHTIGSIRTGLKNPALAKSLVDLVLLRLIRNVAQTLRYGTGNPRALARFFVRATRPTKRPSPQHKHPSHKIHHQRLEMVPQSRQQRQHNCWQNFAMDIFIIRRRK